MRMLFFPLHSPYCASFKPFHLKIKKIEAWNIIPPQNTIFWWIFSQLCHVMIKCPGATTVRVNCTCLKRGGRGHFTLGDRFVSNSRTCCRIFAQWVLGSSDGSGTKLKFWLVIGWIWFFFIFMQNKSLFDPTRVYWYENPATGLVNG